jgi:hypothetical protein
MRKRAVLGGVVCVLTTATLSVVPTNRASAVPLARPADPIVLTGADLPTLNNGPKGTIVGFRWSGTVWQQLPIQIDERAVVNFGKIYNDPSAVFYGSQPGLVNKLVYTSSATWTGNDTNGKFDSDDELAFMARDAGVVSPGGSQPTGTLAGTGVQVHVTDPLSPGSEGYVYLFRRAGNSGLKQGAGVKYLTYKFKLLSGTYKNTYQLTNGPNLENSLVTAGTYKHHFGDRWLSDQINVTAAGATGVDILDRHKALFSPGVCVRSEETFDSPVAGSVEGAFIINKTGPVRGIRSYLGANSGPSTQRTHVFYDRREDIITDLRVHAIPSVMDYMDYSPAASGMTYRNSLNVAGVAVDGNPTETVAAGLPTWEQITGAQGTVTHVGSLTASFTPTVTNYYLDDSTPPVTQCTGDAFAYGQSGAYITSALPCTDPAQGCTDTLESRRTMYFDSPGGTATSAANYQAGVAFPLQASTAPWTP